MNLFSLARKFQTEDAALLHLIRVRWPHGVRCVACDHDKCWLIESKGKTGKPRKLFECASCGLMFSATSNTLFHDSHLPLTKWFAVIALMAEAKKGISANQVRRHVGMTYKTAWYVCHRIRNAMSDVSIAPLGEQGQVLEMDESFIGGSVRGGNADGKKSKIKVFGIAERNGRVHLQQVENIKGETLKKVIDAVVSPNAPQIITDGAPVYKSIIPRDKHVAGNHFRERKAGVPITNRTIEGAFSLFKRGIIGSYHKLGKQHINRYLGEFCWRYNRRRLQPWIFEMTLVNLLNRKPLPYKLLTDDGF